VRRLHLKVRKEKRLVIGAAAYSGWKTAKERNQIYCVLSPTMSYWDSFAPPRSPSITALHRLNTLRPTRICANAASKESTQISRIAPEPLPRLLGLWRQTAPDQAT
jgi:hypothetical protein